MREVALIGGGNMGTAMLKGWLATVTVTPEEVIVCEKDPGKRAALGADLGVAVTDDVEDASRDVRTVVLAVKPQDSAGVLEDIAVSIGEGAAILSIAAGLRISSIRARVGQGPTVVRAMPNVAALAGAAVTAYAVEESRSGLPAEEVVPLLMSIGMAVPVEEVLMDAVTAVSGSGPAYFFLMVESLQEAGVRCGLPEDISAALARETLWGSAKLLKESGREAGELREAVTSPGGTTSAALEVLESEGFRSSMLKAVTAARDRSGELAV